MKNSANSYPSRENPRPVKSFETERGSVYTYLGYGRTQRYKKAAVGMGENPHGNLQDLTVFVRLTPDGQRKYLDAIHVHVSDPAKKKRVYVVEPNVDGTPRIIRNPEDIIDESNIYLAAIQNGRVIGSTKASLIPEVGDTVFDTRHYEKDGGWETERHLGHQVTSIDYA